MSAGPVSSPELVGRLVTLLGGAELDADEETASSFLLRGPETVWFVMAGRVHVFSVELGAAGEPAARRHFVTVEAGGVLCGLPESPSRLALLAVSTVGTVLRRVPLGRLLSFAKQHGAEAAAGALFVAWARLLLRGMNPKDKGGSARSTSGAVVPLFTTDGDSLVAELPAFHRTVLERLGPIRDALRNKEQDRLALLAAADQRQLHAALSHLARVLEEEAETPPADPGRPLRACCKLVFAALGLDPASIPSGPPEVGTLPDLNVMRARLARITYAAQLRVRQVVLRGAWWSADHGPLIGYRALGHAPVALLPAGARGYVLFDGETGTSRRVDAQVAASLHPIADSIYRRLPTEAPSLWRLLRFGLRGARPDLLMVLMLGLLSGLLALGSPLLTGLLFDHVIPDAQRGQLLQIILALVVSGSTVTLFQIASGIAILRVEGRFGAALQAAVWDRLLDLPTRFFRDYSAGDLALRASGIESICRSLSATTLSTLLAGLFSVFSAALMFYYDVRLALLGLLLVLVALVFHKVAGVRHLKDQGALAAQHGRLATLVLEIVQGIAKLRMAGAERRAFGRFAQELATLRRLALRSRAPLQVFESVYPLIASMIIYTAVPLSHGMHLSAGSFLAFVVAFQGLLTATLQAGRAVLSIVGVAPTYSRLRPILLTEPEITPQKGSPPILDGEIELAHVSFRYQAGGPLVLDDLNVHIEPGEFVAITGPSGSGKSTLLRLLLGFEQPSAGAIYLSGQDLLSLDLRGVRRQLGVVLQDGKLLTGDIFSNIVGSSGLSREAALEAARLAGLDRDLASMPMGLHTLISEGGSTMSGGQRQRLLIARALVHRPRLLLFDEATSALDNQTQAMVSRSIEGLSATRVVIAHRLSTIRNADRILVLVGGRLVQSGTYDQLIAVPGPFQDLARRQLTEAGT